MRMVLVGGWRSLVVSMSLASAGCSGMAADPTAPLAPTESSPDVQSIIAAINARYRDAKTYSDEGTLRMVLRPGRADEDITTGRFKTRWVAPDRLSFALQEDPSKDWSKAPLAVWTPRPGVTKALFLEKIEDAESLEYELGALQGVSHVLTGLVPRWLSQGCHLALTYRLQGTVTCGASKCYQLEATPEERRRITLYVSTTTHALMKYEMRDTVPGRLSEEDLATLPPEHREQLAKLSREPFDVVDTIEFNPTFDGPIDDSAFAGPLTP